MQRLPATVPQLVEASPSVAEDGAVLTGTHQSSVYVIDSKTGHLLRVLPSHGKQMLAQHPPGAMQTGNLCILLETCRKTLSKPYLQPLASCAISCNVARLSFLVS